jgi:hypothetical protein
MGANEINLSFVVRQEDAGRALQALHAALIESPGVAARRAPRAWPGPWVTAGHAC